MSRPEAAIYEFGEFRIDIGKRLLLRAGEPVPLTPKVFDTLLYLVQHCDKIVEKNELMLAVWPDTVVEENNLNQNVSTLRRVLGESRGENRYIATVPGKGYRFVGSVTEPDAAHARSNTPTSPIGEVAVPATHLSEGGVNAVSATGHPWLKWFVLPPKPLAFAAAGLLLAVVTAAVAYRYWSVRALGAGPGEVRSLAVLPFKALVAATGDEVLEMGMADTLITKLSTLSEITVRPMAAVRKYIDLNQDPAVVGRQLQVDAVLDGSIQQSNGRIRMTVRLVRASDGKQIWSNKFDKKSGDIFALQDSISEQVAGELALKLTIDERELLAKHYTSDAEAYELYLKGNFFWNKRTADGSRRAIQYFEEALQRDPNYTSAYTGIANCYSAMPISTDVPPMEAFPNAKNAAMKALEIDGRSAEARASRAYIKFFFDWDWEGSKSDYQRALEINPNYPAAHWGYAILLSSLGQHNEALTEIDRALKLDPISSMTGALKGHFLFQARRYLEAIDYLQKNLELDPNFWITHIELGKAYESEGRYEEALKSFRQARDLYPGASETLSLAGYTYAISGRRAEAERMLRSLQTIAASRYVPPYNMALLYHGLGNSDEALNWLDKAYRDRDVHMVFLAVDPKWDRLRDNPRFIALLNSMSFPR